MFIVLEQIKFLQHSTELTFESMLAIVDCNPAL